MYKARCEGNEGTHRRLLRLVEAVVRGVEFAAVHILLRPAQAAALHGLGEEKALTALRPVPGVALRMLLQQRTAG